MLKTALQFLQNTASPATTSGSSFRTFNPMETTLVSISYLNSQPRGLYLAGALFIYFFSTTFALAFENAFLIDWKNPCFYS